MPVMFRDCSADQVEPLQAFFSDMYSPDYVLARDRAFLEWQFAAAPQEERSGFDVKLAEVDGQIAGCIGYIPVPFTLAGRVVRGAWAANWMVDDRYRRLGLGPLLIRELAAQFDVTLALGGNHDAHQLLPRMGWTDFGNLPRSVTVLDPATAGLLVDRDALEELVPPPLCRTQGVERVDQFGPAASMLWDEQFGGTAGTRRSAEYLNWRYRQHPTFDYRMFTLGKHGSLLGVAVYRIEPVRDMAVKVGRIVEVVASRENAVTLLHGIIEDARREGVALLDFFCSSRRLAPAIAEAGMLNGGSTHRVPMLFQPVDPTRTGVLFMAHLRKGCDVASIPDWYVTTADGDQDRPN